MTKTLPLNTTELTPKQKEIINLLLKFRFLNRIQIQNLIHHQYHNRINLWLKELTEKDYLRRFYETKFAATAAVYALGNASRAYLKQDQTIHPALINRVWREHQVSLPFRQRSLDIADIYLSLNNLTKTSKTKLSFYTATDLYGMAGMILPVPDAYFDIKERNGDHKRYFLDKLDSDDPNRLRFRAREYFKYFHQGFWQHKTRTAFPEILLIFNNNRLKNHLNYYIAHKLRREPDIMFYLSTWDQIRNLGLCRETLHLVKIETASRHHKKHFRHFANA
jgi:hypothetical protein